MASSFVLRSLNANDEYNYNKIYNLRLWISFIIADVIIFLSVSIKKKTFFLF